MDILRLRNANGIGNVFRCVVALPVGGIHLLVDVWILAGFSFDIQDRFAVFDLPRLALQQRGKPTAFTFAPATGKDAALDIYHPDVQERGAVLPGLDAGEGVITQVLIEGIGERGCVHNG